MTERDRFPAALPARKWKSRLAMLLGGVGIVVISVAIRCYWGAGPASAEPQAAAQTQNDLVPVRSARADAAAAEPAPATAPQKVVAVVNGEDIGRQDLAQECLRHYGQTVLEALTNKYLIALECQRRNIAVTEEEVNAEIKRYAERFALPVDQWLKMLKEERGIGAAQYGSDIIWPMLALRKLAGQQLAASREELEAEFETQFGPAVKARLIVCGDLDKARKVRAEAAANPAEFGNLASKESEEVASASARGLIQPIRKHLGDPQIEQAAFSLRDGEVSAVLPIGNQYVILQRESLIPAREIRFEQVRSRLEEVVKERKQHDVAGKIFREVQKKATVVNVLNDPALSRQHPGVAAQINGSNVTVRELAERCIERYGEQVLEGTINRRLIEQACRKQNVAVSDADLDEEIARVAAASLPLKADGTPDVQGWITMITERQGISAEVYRRDSVWPTVALRKLVGKSLQVSEDDLKKGYEANYGPRVRCRAIVMSDLRAAQKVWNMARQQPAAERFGELAEKYSIEASTRGLRGQAPPIHRHGDRPKLEEAAFRLKPGEVSEVVQLDVDKYVILFCEGHTTPEKVDFAEVRKLIYEDVYEKKLRKAMADYFQRLQDEAVITNYLTAVSQSPKKPSEAKLPRRSRAR